MLFTSTILGRPVQRDLNAHGSAKFTTRAPVPRRHYFIRPGSQALRHHHSELPSLAAHHPPGPVQPEVVCPGILSLRCIMGMLLAFIANRAGTYLSCSTVCLTSCSRLHVPYNVLAPCGLSSIQRSVVSVGQLAEAVIGCHVCTSKHSLSEHLHQMQFGHTERRTSTAEHQLLSCMSSQT